jgi:hypothetical protein
MSASVVPAVTRRADGTYAVPVAEKLSIVWRIYHDGVQPVLQIKVEQAGCKIYELVEADSASVPICL